MGKKVELINVEGNPNIGNYLFCNDKICLYGQLPKKLERIVRDTLGVPLYKIEILKTELIGVFLAGNNDFIIAPSIEGDELLKLKEICDKYDLKLIISKEELNTFGNNTVVLDNKILIDNEYSDKFKEQLEKETGLEVKKIKLKNIGSLSVFINNHFFVSQDLTDKEIGDINNIHPVSGIGSVSQGGRYIKSGIVGNSKGILISSNSTTIEIQNIVEFLDFI